MLKKLFYFLNSILFAYLFAFFLLITPFTVLQAQAESVTKGNINTLPTNSFEMNANPALIWAVTNGATLSKNEGANYRNTYVYTDTAPLIIAHYTPYAQQGEIALEWVHRFPDENAYNKWVATATKAGLYGNPAQGYLWYSVPVQNQNALPFQAAIYHLLTPQELFRIGSYALPSSMNPGNYGKVFGSSYNYNAVAYCADNNTAGTACSDEAYKIGQQGFFQIVAEVAALYHTFSGFVEVDNQSSYSVKTSSSSLFRTTVTVKVYQVTVPNYYMIAPATTPGISQMGTQGFLVKANASSGYLGFIHVQQGQLGEWGWDFTPASQKIYQKSQSGWNTWVGIVMGGLGMLLSYVLPPAFVLNDILFAGSATYAGLSTVNLAEGNDQFYATNYYNLSNMVANGNDVTKAFIQYSTAYWGAQPLGNQLGGGVKNTFALWDSMQPIQNGGMTTGAYQPSASEKAILQQ